MKIFLTFIAVAVIFPLTLNFAAYFGFVSGYTTNTFSENSFRNQYDNNIYKYRILSNYGIIELNHLLENVHYKNYYNKLSKQLQIMDNEAKVPFYLAYFLWNSIFLIFTSISFYFLLLKILKLELVTVILVSIITNFLIVFTQFVVVPYDNFAYFFEILFFIILFIYFDAQNSVRTNSLISEETRKLMPEFFLKNTWLSFLILPLIMFISTLNRESSAINLSFMASILFYNNKYNVKRWLVLLPSFIAFLIAYIGVRFYLGFDGSALQTDTFIGNIKSPYNLIGLIFCLTSIFIIFVTGNSNSTKINKYFLIFSLPYILTCFISGIMFEYRLWVPIFIGMIVINLRYRDKTYLI